MIELMQIVASVFATAEGGGEEGGGSGPTAAPSIGLYEYSGNTRFGISVTAGDALATHELEMDGSEYAILPAGNHNVDVGLKAGNGTHTWRARSLLSGTYSSYSATLTTVDGVEQ